MALYLLFVEFIPVYQVIEEDCQIVNLAEIVISEDEDGRWIGLNGMLSIYSQRYKFVVCRFIGDFNPPQADAHKWANYIYLFISFTIDNKIPCRVTLSMTEENPAASCTAL